PARARPRGTEARCRSRSSGARARRCARPLIRRTGGTDAEHARRSARTSAHTRDEKDTSTGRCFQGRVGTPAHPASHKTETLRGVLRAASRAQSQQRIDELKSICPYESVPAMSSPQLEVPSDWYRFAYPPEMAKLPWAQKTGVEVDRLLTMLKPQGSERILDLACGTGRHTLELRRRGFPVVGVELLESNVKVAQDAAEEQSLDVEFIQAD